MMYPFKDLATGLYGYARDHDWLIEPKFYSVLPFRGGRAIVQPDEGDYCLLYPDSECIRLLPMAQSVFPGGHIEDVFECSMDPAARVMYGLALAQGDKHGFVVIDSDLTPTLVATHPKSVASTFFEYSGWALLKTVKNGQLTMGYVDPASLELKILPLLGFYQPSADGHWVVSESIGPDHNVIGPKSAFFSIDDLEVVSRWYEQAVPFSEGYGLFLHENAWRFVDREMQPVAHLVFDWADEFQHGLAAGERGDESGYFDRDGRLVFQLAGDYMETYPFDRAGHALLVSDDYKCYLIDRHGNVVLRDATSIGAWDGDYFYYKVSWASIDEAIARGTLDEDILLTPDLTHAVKL